MVVAVGVAVAVAVALVAAAVGSIEEDESEVFWWENWLGQPAGWTRNSE